MKRKSQNPKRRLARSETLNETSLDELAQCVRYVASGHHKRFPANYGLEWTSPRPAKSLCDDIRTIQLEEARSLLEEGVKKGTISDPVFDSLPKYVWAVDQNGQVYEAKTDIRNPGAYHGYRLEEADPFRHCIIARWQENA